MNSTESEEKKNRKTCIASLTLWKPTLACCQGKGEMMQGIELLTQHENQSPSTGITLAPEMATQ